MTQFSTPKRYTAHSRDTALLVMDMQEKFSPVIWQWEEVRDNVVKMIKAADILHLPVILTEHYPEGLGPIVPEILAAAEGRPIVKKTTFSCCNEDLMARLRREWIKTILLCGIETHVCIMQTALDFLAVGFAVHVIADATSSRAQQNRQLALERIRAAGGIISSVEMALFELLKQSGTSEFRAILQLVK